MSIIDMHAYLGKGVYTQQDVSELLRQMDRCGISRTVVTAADQYVAVYNREGNDAVLAAVRAHPDRLSGLAVVNPWYGQKGLDELSRCVQQGLLGLALDTRQQGCFFTDTIVYDLVARARELKVPVYCHAGTPLYSLPLGLMELALDFPEIAFIMGSAGYADGWYDAIPAVSNAPNIFIDTSHIFVQLIERVREVVGAQRILFASDAPISSLETELSKIRLLDLDEESNRLILGGNAARLLGVMS